jgi:hypothetical protein
LRINKIQDQKEISKDELIEKKKKEKKQTPPQDNKRMVFNKIIGLFKKQMNLL